MTKRYYLTVCSLGENPNLESCIQGLLRIKDSSQYNVEVLLVINQVQSEHSFDSRVQVSFEPLRGYSNVRNKAISLVPKNANIVFIDDDEIPTESWFAALVEAHLVFDGDLIFGPVYPVEVTKSGSYRSQASKKYQGLSTGDLVSQAPTANMLIPAVLLDKQFIKFDPIFNTSGSEDTDLCFRLRNLGVGIRFAKDAVIYEREKPQRFDEKYLQARKKKDIANYSLVIRRNSSSSKILWRFCTLVLRIAWYSLVSLVNQNAKVSRDAYYFSVVALIVGKPREF
jgi:cellulose synthase/poly-beta-1,6-N-acetylglucosamine synthase-like glycosyltransferase